MEKTKKANAKKNSPSRAPIVTIMGHVDHGKTTLLDYIRSTKVAEKEHGGITQHIGAYQITKDGKTLTFIDTPGHAAFSAMRARGANITDIVVLVVAADDGVMPQTKESITHIKSAGVPMIVAINKMDAPGANVDRVKKGLSEAGVLVEGYGGDVVTVPISAKTGQGVNELLEMINLIAEMAELKDESSANFEGVVIESSLDKFRGPLATILVKKGKIKVGDQIKSKGSSGKVKSLIDSDGKQLKEAGVSMPVEILGFEKVPGVGETVTMENSQNPELHDAEDRTEKRDPFAALANTGKTQINLIVKADVVGSLEAIIAAVESLSDQERKVNIVHKETGEVSDSDVLLAASTRSLVISFNVKIAKSAEKLAEEEKVMIRSYSIIYELLDELKEGLELLVDAKREKILGKGQIIAIFDTSHGKIAGTEITEARLAKGDRVRFLRNEEEIGSTRIKSIRHLQKEINTAKEGEECGLLFENFEGFDNGDTIVAFS